MANQDTSIGSDSATPVDGIRGSNPGTQQPSGAHVDAGEGPGAGQPPAKKPVTGQNSEGSPQPGGVTGAMGRQARALQPGQLDHMVRGKFNGSLAFAGKTVGVRIGCGAMSLQQVSRH